MNAHDADVLVAQVEILALIALLVRPEVQVWSDGKRLYLLSGVQKIG